MSFVIRPILLAFEATPDEAYVAPLENAISGPNGIGLWFHAYGLALDWRPVERLAYTGPDYRLNTDNPWYDVWRFLQLGPEEWAVAVLVDWIEPGPVGWGGTPLAIAGSYTANRLLSTGTPEYLADDWLAEGVLAHEVGHVWGLPHDTTRENNIMGVGLWRYPECGPSQLMIDLAGAAMAPPAPARLMSVGPHMFATPCPERPE